LGWEFSGQRFVGAELSVAAGYGHSTEGPEGVGRYSDSKSGDNVETIYAVVAEIGIGA
jgi:hypothetical protein